MSRKLKIRYAGALLAFLMFIGIYGSNVPVNADDISGEWKCDSHGWWYEDSNGWYPTSEWMTIDEKTYYLCRIGMCTAIQCLIV